MVVKIISIKVVGLCSIHQNKDFPTPTDKLGNIIKDKDIECVGCSLEKPLIIEKFSKKTIDLENNIVKNNHLEIIYQDKIKYGEGLIKIEKWTK